MNETIKAGPLVFRDDLAQVVNLLAVHEDRIVKAADVPPSSPVQGNETFSDHEVQFDLGVVRYRHERRLTPDG